MTAELDDPKQLEEVQLTTEQAAPYISGLDDIAMAGDFPTLVLIQSHITGLLSRGCMGIL